MNKLKKILAELMLLIVFLFALPLKVYAEEACPELTAASFILMEASTGEIILEKDSGNAMSPASITKLMTLYLIFEALEEGKIKLEEEVVTSSYAKSMGGSQVFLEEGELQTVDTLIKCIAVASGNDACVAMAEKISGSEEEFVKRMNEKAKSLGLQSTHFCDCSGLSDSDEHYMSAKDIALIAQNLLNRFPQILNYSQIWMEDIVHETKKGAESFTLANTNKLLKQYPYATGLKTGSTSKAKYCLCATAKQNNMNLIAVIMAAPDFKCRFKEAQMLLEYGYRNCGLYRDEMPIKNQKIKVLSALKESIPVKAEKSFEFLLKNGETAEQINKEVVLPEAVEAPLQKGQEIGCIRYLIDGNEIGKVSIISEEDVLKAGFMDCFIKLLKIFF